MGIILGKVMEESAKKNQQFMLASQRSQMERQMHMQNAMREQQMAIQIARARDLFLWWSAFYGVATLGMIAGYRKSRRPQIIAPLVPLTFILAYQADLAYGTKLRRIRAEADRILQKETKLLDLPHPLPSIEDLDRRRDSRQRRLY